MRPRKVFLGVFFIALLFIVVFVVTRNRPTPRATGHPFEPDMCTAASQPMNTSNNITISRQATAAYYDEQLWLGFANNVTSLSYNVTAVAQNDTYGFGPGYLLNGLTNLNIWYQAGVSWNWPNYQSRSHDNGFFFLYEIWNATTHKFIEPKNGSRAGIFSNSVHSGDTVLLSLSIGEDLVNMSARDWESNATASVTFASYGATVFIGSRGPEEEYPTSLLTEWYHVLPFFCSEQIVVFSNRIVPAYAGWLSINEWNFTGIPVQQWFNASDRRQFFFGIGTQASNLTATVGALEGNGTRIYANSTDFWTM